MSSKRIPEMSAPVFIWPLEEKHNTQLLIISEITARAIQSRYFLPASLFTSALSFSAVESRSGTLLFGTRFKMRR